MLRHVDAIFSQGTFRPLQPLALPEGTRVHLSVEEQPSAQPAALAAKILTPKLANPQDAAISSWKCGRQAMQAYDAARFDPPAPLALVNVRSEQLGIVIRDVPMLLDTGADVSLLPRSHVAQFESADAKQYELQAFDGTKSRHRRIGIPDQVLSWPVSIDRWLAWHSRPKYPE
jgi:predicted DNA-binding antitoxin AbrB/MazE fold protein